MLKKTLILFTVVSLVSSCNIIPLNLSNISIDSSTKSKGFSIKSSTNLNEIKKVFLPVTRIEKSKNKKEKDDKKSKIFKFNVLNSDLKRDFILNLINGSGGGEKIGNLEVKVNGKQIIFNNPEGFEDIDDIHKIKKELCKDEDKKFNVKHDKDDDKKNKLDFSIVMQNFFNRKTNSLGARMWGIKEGENILEINIKDERKNYSLDVSIDGFLDSFDIPNAIHSRMPENDTTRKLDIEKGIVNIKFSEGLKVRLVKDSSNSYKFVDLNGISLTSLDRLLKIKNIKDYIKSIDNLSVEEIDKKEYDSEQALNYDVPNQNLFFTLIFDSNSDVWNIIDELRKLPFIEEAFPDFIPTTPSCSLPNDIYVNKTINDKSQYNWLEATKISDKLFDKTTDSFSHIPINESEYGAWRYGRGDQNKGVAILDAWFEHPGMGNFKDSTNISLHEDFDNNKISFMDMLETPINPINKNPRGIYDLSHGTAAAGIIGAKSNNNRGISGITDAKMLWMRSYQPELKAGTDYPYTDTVYGNFRSKNYGKRAFSDSLEQLMDSKFDYIKVVLLELQVGKEQEAGKESDSIGTGRLAEDDPLNRELIRDLANKYNKVIIEPAGNAYQTDIRMAEYKKQVIDIYDASGLPFAWHYESEGLKPRQVIGTLIVGGLDWELRSSNPPTLKKENTLFYNYGKTDFDEYGIQNKEGHGIDISAPASNVFSTGSKYREEKYFNFSGTSSASPIIAGIVQLMLSVNPDLKPVDIRGYLRLSSQQGSAGITTDGKTTAGMVDAYKAVKLAAEGKVKPESCASVIEGSNGIKTLQYNGDQSAYIVGNNTNVPVKTGDKIAIPMTDALLQRLQNIDIKTSSGQRLTYYEIVNHYAVYGIPPEMASSSQNVVAKDLSTGETLFTFEQALYRAALALNLNPITPPDALMLPNSTSYPPFISDNTSRDVRIGDIVAAALYGLSKNDNVTVNINGQNMPIYDQRDGYVSFGIQEGLSGNQNVSISNQFGTVIYNNSLNILSDFSKSFPESISSNGFTKYINYGFNFDFNENSGSTVFDKSGKNNNSTLETLHTSYPIRINSTGLNFTPGSYVKVPYSSSYNLPSKFTFLATLKLHEKNRQQLLLHKWEDGYVNGSLVQSYGWYIDSNNKLTLTLADNRNEYYSITHNASLNLDLEKDIGIAVIVDLENKTVKMIKNQTVVDANIVYDGIFYHYSSLNQFNSVKNSMVSLSIGNYTSIMQGDYSLSNNLNADLTNIASIVEEIKPEEVSKLFYDMGLRD